jgi:hypothetical protein
VLKILEGNSKVYLKLLKQPFIEKISIKTVGPTSIFLVAP